MIAPDGETQTDAASPLRAQQGEGNTEFENLAQRHLDAVAGGVATIRRKARELTTLLSVTQYPLLQRVSVHIHGQPVRLHRRLAVTLVAANFQVHHQAIGPFGHAMLEVQTTRYGIRVQSSENGVQQKLPAVHGAGALVRSVAGRAHPLEVSADQSVHPGAHISRLRNIAGAHNSADDRGVQLFRRNSFEGVVHVGEMPAIEFVEVAIVGRVMLRPVPPVPVAALGDEQLFPRQFALRRRNFLRMAVVIIAGFGEQVPGAIIFGRANPDVEVGIDPRTRDQPLQGLEVIGFVEGDGFADGDRFHFRVMLQGIVEAAQKFAA